jgi:hypothetical protein
MKQSRPHVGANRQPAPPGTLAPMTFSEHDKVWVHFADGLRPAVWVGGGENANFFGGPPLAYVVFTDTREGAEVDLDRVTPRDE